VVQVGQFLHLPLQSFLGCSPQSDLHLAPDFDILHPDVSVDFAAQHDFAAAFSATAGFSFLQQLLPQADTDAGTRENPVNSSNGSK
jgi:hypothetical protein